MYCVYMSSLNVASLLAVLLNMVYLAGVVYVGVTVTRMDKLGGKQGADTVVGQSKDSLNVIELELTTLNA